MKTAVIYARYSSNSQTEQSIEGQLRVCQQFAQNNDLLIVDTYIDRAMTGTNDNRVAFQKMLADSKKKQFDFVIVYKLDRFARNKFEAVNNRQKLKENGVRLLSAMENIPDTPEGNLMESLLEGFNQYFSEELRQKVNRGLKESWLKGNATGGNGLFGYDIVDKKYIVNAYETQIVQEIFTKYAQGYKAVAIAEELKMRGAKRKNGKLIDIKYVYYILHNERYTGKVEHHGIIYDKIFPQIISDELWLAVNAINEENKIAPSRKKEIFDYILSGKLVCGDCKRRMSGESGTSHTGDIHYYYLCTSRRKKKMPCTTKAVTKQYLEDLVINATASVLYSEENIRIVAENMYRTHEKETKDSTVLKLLLKQRQEAQKKTDNLIKAIEQGIITEQTKTRLKELEQEILQIDFDIDREKQRNYTFLSVENIVEFLQSKVFADTDNIKVRKLIVNTFIREIIYYPDKIIITYNFTDNVNTVKITPENIIEIEKQSNSASSLNLGSCLLPQSAPKTLYQSIQRFIQHGELLCHHLKGVCNHNCVMYVIFSC